MKKFLTTFLAAILIATQAYAGKSAKDYANWPRAGELFVGANYQPVDRSAEQIKYDIALMKESGFNVVRIGDLSWDAYEPEENKFTFELFDSVMDQLHAAGLKVILDILSGYKLVVVPGYYMMDTKSANAIRNYVKNGGTVVMTAFSAKVNETNQWFNTPLPGGLTDVFGLTTNEFYHAGTELKGQLGQDDITTSIDFYEVLKPKTTKVLGRFVNVEGKPPIATVNDFGKGRAIYVATPAQPSVMQALYRQLYQELAIKPGPVTPEGVFAREVNGRMLMVNTTTEAKDVKVSGNKLGVLSGNVYKNVVALPAYGVELVE